MKEKGGSHRTEKWTTADEQYLKVMFLQNTKQIQKMPDSGLKRYCISGPSFIQYSLYSCQKWFQWRGGCKEAIFKKEKQGQKVEVCQELD